MASTYSSLKIELIGTGDQSGTWGATTNNNFQFAIEDAITGTGQKAKKFWSWVFEIYVELIPDGKDRTSTACTARCMGNNQSRCDKVLRPLFTGYVHC